MAEVFKVGEEYLTKEEIEKRRQGLQKGQDRGSEQAVYFRKTKIIQIIHDTPAPGLWEEAFRRSSVEGPFETPPECESGEGVSENQEQKVITRIFSGKAPEDYFPFIIHNYSQSGRVYFIANGERDDKKINEIHEDIQEMLKGGSNVEEEDKQITATLNDCRITYEQGNNGYIPLLSLRLIGDPENVSRMKHKFDINGIRNSLGFLQYDSWETDEQGIAYNTTLNAILKTNFSSCPDNIIL